MTYTNLAVNAVVYSFFFTFQNQKYIRKRLPGTPLECQTVYSLIRPDVLSDFDLGQKLSPDDNSRQKLLILVHFELKAIDLALKSTQAVFFLILIDYNNGKALSTPLQRVSSQTHIRVSFSLIV